MSETLYEVFPTFLKNFSIRIDILKVSKNGSIFLIPLVGFSRNNDKKRADVNKKVLHLYIHLNNEIKQQTSQNCNEFLKWLH